MVARWQQFESSLRNAVSALTAAVRAWFLTWRMLLTRALRVPLDTVKRIRYRPRPDLVLGFLRDPEETAGTDRATDERLAAIGIRAFIAGSLIYFLAIVLNGEATGTASIRMLSGVAWAAVRLGILLFYAHRDTAERPLVITGWAIGLIPYAIGATAGIRILAFLASAVYTDAAMSGMGLDRQRAHSLVLRSFGAQAIVITVAWAFRTITTAIVLLGGSL